MCVSVRSWTQPSKTIQKRCSRLGESTVLDFLLVVSSAHFRVPPGRRKGSENGSRNGAETGPKMESKWDPKRDRNRDSTKHKSRRELVCNNKEGSRRQRIISGSPSRRERARSRTRIRTQTRNSNPNAMIELDYRRSQLLGLGIQAWLSFRCTSSQVSLLAQDMLRKLALQVCELEL